MPPLPPIPPQYRFTRAEREILALLAEGLTYTAIARRVGREVGTVKTHVHHIAAKLPPAPDVQPLHRVLHWLWELDIRQRTTKAA